MKNLLLLLVSLAMLSACASADKMLEKGDYDGLVNLATRKLSGKKKKDEYVVALETAFEKITRRDMARIEALKESNDPDDWEEIMSIARHIEYRQDKVEPFLPLVSESGYQAKFTFVKTDKILSEAKITAVRLYEKQLDVLVEGARKGDKKEARSAFYLIDRIRTMTDKYYQNDLRDEMWSIGINRILVRMENNSHAIIPADIEEELLSADISNYGGDWDKFYTEVDEDTPLDYEVVLKITDIAVSNDQWHEHQYPYTREIKDGWEYVLDQNGNVAKDSLGNDIKRDKYIKVSATVVEGVQTKSALIRTRMEIYNAHNHVRVYSQPLEFENVFTHTARNFFGDERALDSHLRHRIMPVGFPSDGALIFDAFRGLKPKFFNEVKRANYSV